VTLATTHLSIAGFVIQVTTTEPLLRSFLGRAGAYQVPAEAPDIVLEVEEDPCFVPPAPPQASYPAPDGVFQDGRYTFWRRDLLVHVTPGSPTQAHGRCQSGLGIAVENILRLCLSTCVPLRGGLMLHASAVEHEGKGFVFTGVSGSGKSTVIKLLQGAGVARSLGDEVTVLRITADGITVHSTPFGGELPPVPPGKAPLCRLFLLHPSRVFPREPSLAAVRLLRNALAVCPTENLASAILANAETVVCHADCRALYQPSAEELMRALKEPVTSG